MGGGRNATSPGLSRAEACELLSRADLLATQLGGAVFAAGFGASMRKHAGVFGRYGADRVVVLEAPALESYTPETAAEAIASVIKEREPWGLFLSASERGRDWGPRLAARLGLGLTGDAIGLEIDQQNRLVALKPAFGGNIVAPILSRTLPQMATVRSGVLELADPSENRRAEVEVLHPQTSKPLSRLVKEHSLMDTTIEPLEGAEIIVGLGTGVGAEGVAPLKDFARVLRAGMCATRRVTDAGWMPRQLQVGLTGKAIDPRAVFLGRHSRRDQPHHRNQARADRGRHQQRRGGTDFRTRGHRPGGGVGQNHSRVARCAAKASHVTT